MFLDATTSANGSNQHRWNADLVFNALENPIRRAIIFSLARNGDAQTAADLVSGGRSVNAVIKQLAWLRKAKIVIDGHNVDDRRKQLYRLSGQVPVIKTETGSLIDFGCVQLRL